MKRNYGIIINKADTDEKSKRINELERLVNKKIRIPTLIGAITGILGSPIFYFYLPWAGKATKWIANLMHRGPERFGDVIVIRGSDGFTNVMSFILTAVLLFLPAILTVLIGFGTMIPDYDNIVEKDKSDLSKEKMPDWRSLRKNAFWGSFFLFSVLWAILLLILKENNIIGGINFLGI